jgi:hypothetical protein
MKTIAVIVICILLSSLAAHARVGETFEQCVVRYGQPIKKDSESGEAIFYKAPYRLIAHFHEGKADVVLYQKVSNPGEVIPIFAELDDDELTGLLDLYATIWEALPVEEAFYKGWQAKNGLIAWYSGIEKYMVVSSSEGAKRFQERLKDQKAKDIKGL